MFVGRGWCFKTLMDHAVTFFKLQNMDLSFGDVSTKANNWYQTSFCWFWGYQYELLSHVWLFSAPLDMTQQALSMDSQTRGGCCRASPAGSSTEDGTRTHIAQAILYRLSHQRSLDISLVFSVTCLMTHTICNNNCLWLVLASEAQLRYYVFTKGHLPVFLQQWRTTMWL